MLLSVIALAVCLLVTAVTRRQSILASPAPWNDDAAMHVPTALDAGGVMRVRACNGWYSVEAKDGDGWRVHVRTLRRTAVDRLVDEYTG